MFLLVSSSSSPPFFSHLFSSLIAHRLRFPNWQLLAFLKSDSTEDLNKFYSQILGNILAYGSLIGGPSSLVANGLWIDQTLPLKPSFKHVVDSVYKAAYELVDFQHKASEVADKVNLLVEKETKGLINHIVPAIVPASAIYKSLQDSTVF
nr:serpin-ZX-like [Ipomoea batatas]